MDQFLDVIRSGRRVFMARFAVRDNAEGTAPDWSTPTSVTLFVRLRDKAYKKHPVGEIIELVPTNVDFATFSEESYCGNGEFMTENYRMQLLPDIAAEASTPMTLLEAAKAAKDSDCCVRLMGTNRTAYWRHPGELHWHNGSGAADPVKLDQETVASMWEIAGYYLRRPG